MEVTVEDMCQLGSASAQSLALIHEDRSVPGRESVFDVPTTSLLGLILLGLIPSPITALFCPSSSLFCPPHSTAHGQSLLLVSSTPPPSIWYLSACGAGHSVLVAAASTAHWPSHICNVHKGDYADRLCIPLAHPLIGLVQPSARKL